MVLRPLCSEDAAVAFRIVDLTLSDDVFLSTLEGKNLESKEVFLVESSAVGENTPLTSVDGARDEMEEKSHCGIATPSPLAP